MSVQTKVENYLNYITGSAVVGQLIPILVLWWV